MSETIRHRVGIDAPPERVYDALTTTEGLAQWWTRDVFGDAGAGGTVSFRFGGPDARVAMRVVDAVPDRHVEWRCVKGPDEWLDTVLTFDIDDAGDETALSFTHTWREPVAFMHHCSTKWGYFLLGMKAALEGRGGTPYPDDLKVSSWG